MRISRMRHLPSSPLTKRLSKVETDQAAVPLVGIAQHAQLQSAHPRVRAIGGDIDGRVEEGMLVKLAMLQARRPIAFQGAANIGGPS